MPNGRGRTLRPRPLSGFFTSRPGRGTPLPCAPPLRPLRPLRFNAVQQSRPAEGSSSVCPSSVPLWLIFIAVPAERYRLRTAARSAVKRPATVIVRPPSSDVAEKVKRPLTRAAVELVITTVPESALKLPAPSPDGRSYIAENSSGERSDALSLCAPASVMR